jgi:hypothetical protein
MPLERLIDLLAEAAVRKLSQQREKQEAAPDETSSTYLRFEQWPQLFHDIFTHTLAHQVLGS